MNTKISDETFDNCYNYIKDEIGLKNFTYETEDTDIVTGTDLIFGAAYDLKREIPPEKIFLYQMDNFLNSMYRIIENSPELKKDEQEYLYSQKFSNALSIVYQGLLERHVIPVPFLLPKETLQYYIGKMKESRKLFIEMPNKQFKPICFFRGNIYIEINNQSIRVKIFITKLEKGYFAGTNIVFPNDNALDMNWDWDSNAREDTPEEALCKLISTIIKYLNRFHNKFWFDDRHV